jgi:REP element-mobilizing transposase RayT
MRLYCFFGVLHLKDKNRIVFLITKDIRNLYIRQARYAAEIPAKRQNSNFLKLIKNWKNMDKYRNKYRIPSARAAWWDYSSNGCYFITICTKHRKCLFGNIVNGIMNLSKIGEIVDEEWNKSFDIRKELFCDTFIIMPNHIHAILRIEKNNGEQTACRGARPCASTGKPFRVPKSISSFVAGFKSAATTRINGYCNTPKMAVWQTRFHDHIIRNEKEYERIRIYIVNNPEKWNDDTHN